MCVTQDGRSNVEQQGLTYHSHFISDSESKSLITYFSSLRPIWEERHSQSAHQRSGEGSRRLTRPVYWLGAWQFACLGYYSEPEYVDDRCVRAEPFPQVVIEILERTRPMLEQYHCADQRETITQLPNTCLINYYGRQTAPGVPIDYARLRRHKDCEPGPVIMFSIGQPGLLEFTEPEQKKTPIHSQWIRHRSLTIFSGATFKDRLFHQISKVRTGKIPALPSSIENFQTRRVSVSFRSVPQQKIADYHNLPLTSQQQVRVYMEKLALHSKHFQTQLDIDKSKGSM